MLRTTPDGPVQDEFLGRSAIGVVHPSGEDELRRGEREADRMSWLLWSVILTGALIAFVGWAHHLSQAVLSSPTGRTTLMEAVLQMPGPICSSGLAVTLVGACGLLVRWMMCRRRSGN